MNTFLQKNFEFEHIQNQFYYTNYTGWLNENEATSILGREGITINILY